MLFGTSQIYQLCYSIWRLWGNWAVHNKFNYMTAGRLTSFLGNEPYDQPTVADNL